MRVFGSVTRRDILRLSHQWFPVTYANDLTYLGMHCGGKIDAGGERAHIEIHLPYSLNNLVEAILWLVPLETSLQNIRYDIEYGTCDELYNSGGTGDAFTVDGTLNTIYCKDITSGLSYPTIAPEDLVGLRVNYVASGEPPPPQDTNMFVLGVSLRWR